MKAKANLFIVSGWILAFFVVIKPAYELIYVGVPDSDAGAKAFMVMIGLIVCSILLGIGYSIKKLTK